jgi:membrane protein
MAGFQNVVRWFRKISWVRTIEIYINRVVIPGFDRVPFLIILKFFFKGIVEGYITSRASAIAFSFFLALFPALIFLFSLIPFIPIENFQGELINQIQLLLPKNAYDLVEATLKDLVEHKRTSLLSFGIITTLYFSTNGINSIISAFNLSYHTLAIRTWLSQQITALWLTLSLFLFVITAVTLIIFGQDIIVLLIGKFELLSTVEWFLLFSAKWIIIIALIYFSISLLYYAGPKEKDHWKFFSAGSTLSTVCIILFSLGFAYYVNNFGQYNKLYGSIGTLLVVMVWIYLNCIALLIGYELNAAIKGARTRIMNLSSASLGVI